MHYSFRQSEYKCLSLVQMQKSTVHTVGGGLFHKMLSCNCKASGTKMWGGDKWGCTAAQARHMSCMLHSISSLLRLGTQSRPQVAQSVPFSSSPHALAMWNL